jgi:YggT family protein
MSAAWLLIKILDVIIWLVLARVIISWVNLSEENPVRKMLETTVDPFMEPLKKVMVVGNFDLSPIVVIFGLSFVQRAIASSLM